MNIHYAVCTLMFLIGSCRSELLNFTFSTPNIRLTHDNVLICQSIRVPEGKDNYLVGYEADIQPTVYHHLTTMVCKEPGSKFPVWDCGSINFGNPEEGLPKGMNCNRTYANRNLEKFTYTVTAYRDTGLGLHYPPGTGLKVGGDSGYNWIVMFTHFPELSNLTHSMTGVSNITYTISRGTRLKQVNTLYMLTYGYIAPHSIGITRGSLEWRYNITAHLFTYSVHTHRLALRVKQWKVDHVSGAKTLLLDQDAQDQRFYSMQADLTSKDRLEYECMFNNTLDTVVEVKVQEMCTILMYYYVDGEELPDQIYYASNWELIHGGELSSESRA